MAGQVGEEQIIAGGGAHHLKPFVLPGGVGGVAFLQKSGGELPSLFGREFPRLLQHTF
ncbi:MAG TPA: hypothetical protein VFR82_13315 [Nitrospira sp.]|nr:hypothetical protein [Nitrospira sp.]